MEHQSLSSNTDELIKLATSGDEDSELKDAELFILEKKLSAGDIPVPAKALLTLFQKEGHKKDDVQFFLCLKRRYRSIKNKYGTFYFLDDTSKETIMNEYNADIKDRIYATKEKRLKKKAH